MICGGFCSSTYKVYTNPIYAYQWFQPNDVCEEWHKVVFIYACYLARWNEVSISKIYDKFLDLSSGRTEIENICITMEALSFNFKSEYYKILLIHIINFRSFL